MLAKMNLLFATAVTNQTKKLLNVLQNLLLLKLQTAKLLKFSQAMQKTLILYAKCSTLTLNTQSKQLLMLLKVKTQLFWHLFVVTKKLTKQNLKKQQRKISLHSQQKTMTDFALETLDLLALLVTAFAGALAGLGLVESVSVSLSMVGNIGPAFGAMGPTANYAALPAALKWWYAFAMLAGRLELYTMLILLGRAAARIRPLPR